jgi:hypothetical protein
MEPEAKTPDYLLQAIKTLCAMKYPSIEGLLRKRGFVAEADTVLQVTEAWERFISESDAIAAERWNR